MRTNIVSSSFSRILLYSLLLLVLFLSFFYLSPSSIKETNPSRDVDLENPVLDFSPSSLKGYLPTAGSPRDVSCERVRVVGVSILHVKKYINSVRVTLIPSVAIPERLHSKIEVCFHRNASMGLCQCAKGEWRTIQNGQWSAVMSPYENRYLDVKVLGGTSGVITVSIKEEFHKWRLYCLVFGFFSLLLAPLISDWVPFYYSSSMAIGVLLLVLMLLFQGMKLLPTGRRSALYFTLYGSVLGLGSYIIHYFSMLINSILVNFGLSEDMYSPVSIVVGVLFVLSGAALGYGIVRKFVISEDGKVDAGIAQFMKWAVRIIAMAFIFQSTLDTRLAILALVSCWGISAEIQHWCTGSNKTSVTLWWRKGKHASRGRKHAEFLSPKRTYPGVISPIRGYYSSPPMKRTTLTPERDFYSTFGVKPKVKKFSKKEWEDLTMDYTKQALAELTSSPEFTDWVVENADRIKLEPEESSDDSEDSGAVLSEETVVEEESVSKKKLFSW